MGEPKLCDWCAMPLDPPKRRFCSPECAKLRRRWDWVKAVYGINGLEYWKIMVTQDSRCGCCRKPFKDGQTPHIDHEHGGHVRGIVCAYCNTRLIGRLKNHETAQKLADYLKDPPAVRALGRKVIAPGRPKRKRRATSNRKGQAQQQDSVQHPR